MNRDSKSHHVWIVEDDRSLRWVMARALDAQGVAVTEFPDAERFADALEDARPDLVVMDVRLPGQDGLSALGRLSERFPDLPVVVTTAQSDLATAVQAYDQGAFDYLPKPFDIDEFTALIKRGLEQPASRESASEPEPSRQPALIGRSPAMQQLFRTIGRLSQSEVGVLITGESGSGKELVARALHHHSPRASGPFVAINTAAVPRELLESELFGHERGAFTGAVDRRTGRFEQADGGTLFLDEIGDMPLELQTRLLRVLAEREFYRVGAHQARRADVRVLAATHQDLEQRIAEGGFREDLYHRLNVIRLNVPPLRQRPEDIPDLAEHFLALSARETGLAPRQLTDSALRELQSRPWPGNVRELMNLCRRITVMSPARTVGPEDLPESQSGENTQDWTEAAARWVAARHADGEERLAALATEALERRLIQWALEQSGGRRQEAARLLGWGRNTLTRKLRAHGMN